MSQPAVASNRRIQKLVVGYLLFCAAGVFFTGLSLAYSSQYCMGGTGYGFPFAVFHPGHGDSVWAIQLEPEAKTHGWEFDMLFLLGNVIFWHLVAIVGVCFFQPHGDPLAKFGTRS